MLEYFSFKKAKKAQADRKEKRKSQVQVADHPEPLISPEDEKFLGRVISAEGTPPPLPARPAWVTNPVVGDSTGNESQMAVLDRPEVFIDLEERPHHDTSLVKKSDSKRSRRRSSDKGKGKEKEKEKEKEKSGSVFSFLSKKNKDGLEANKIVSDSEAEDETEDISKVLEDLEFTSSSNKTFSISAESQKLVKKFTVVLKDLINGVPTAYDDLVSLLKDSEGTLAKSYDHLPPFMQKMVTTLPNKMTSTFAPELLAVATAAQADIKGTIAEEESANVNSSGGLNGAAQGLIGSIGLRELVTKPGAVAKLLKSIMNALKLRWPAFMGTNVLLSLSLFVLLFVFWYCHKRGRETRLEREGKPVEVDSEGRIVEPPDDSMIQPDASGTTGAVNDPVLPGPAGTALVAEESDNGIIGGMSGPSTRRREKDRSSSSNESGRERHVERRRRRRSGEGRRRSGDDRR